MDQIIKDCIQYGATTIYTGVPTTILQQMTDKSKHVPQGYKELCLLRCDSPDVSCPWHSCCQDQHPRQEGMEIPMRLSQQEQTVSSG